jgi:hypothetical protein
MSPRVAVILCRDAARVLRPEGRNPSNSPRQTERRLSSSLMRLRKDRVTGAGPANDTAGSGGRNGAIRMPHRTATVSARYRVCRPDVPPAPRPWTGTSGLARREARTVPGRGCEYGRRVCQAPTFHQQW